jgi:formate dehydrogenase subunit gamma
MEKRPDMIRRHSAGAIFMHWFNAGCWIALLATGLGLIDNPELQPLGMWWVRTLHALGLDGVLLLQIHATLGLVWASVYAVFSLVRLKSETWPFLREVSTFSPQSDLTWVLRKTLTLTVGEERLRARGLATELPAQGFYNAGQKLFAVPAVMGSAGLVATGLVALFSRAWPGGADVVQWALAIHFLCAALVAVGLVVHVYMATIAPGEGPAFRSMFTGFVPEDFARHHNPLWHARVAAGRDETLAKRDKRSI